MIPSLKRDISQKYILCSPLSLKFCGQQDSNLRHALLWLLYRLSYARVVPLRELHARHRVRSSELTDTAPAYGVELI